MYSHSYLSCNTKGKAPLLFLQSNRPAVYLPLIHIHTFQCFHRVPLTEHIQCRSQPSLIFPALYKARSGSPCCFAVWWAAGTTKLAVSRQFCGAALRKATHRFSSRGAQERGKGITAIMHCNGDYQSRDKRSFQTRCKTPQCFQSSLCQLWTSGNPSPISEAG